MSEELDTKKVNQEEEQELFFENIEEQEEFLDGVWDNLREGREHTGFWRDKAHQEEEFFAGDQWSEDDREKLRIQQRPIITFNRIVKTINAIAGMQLQNRQEINYEPTEQDDNGFAQVLTQASKWARNKVDAEIEESVAFQDCVKIGMGWMETRIDYEVDLDGQIFIERIDPFEMVWDPNSYKSNLSDARWIGRVKEMSYKEFKEYWPDIEPTAGDFWEGFNAPETNANQTERYKYKNNDPQPDSKKNPISIIQYQYWVRDKVYRYRDLDGKVKIATEEEFEKIKPILDEQNIPYVKQYKRVYKQAFINGRNLLDHGPCPVNDFTLLCLTGIHDKPNNIWFGLIRLMRDPQMWSNKWLSQLLFIINSNAKGGLLVEEGAFKNPRQAVENWAQPNSITQLNPGGLNKIRDKNPPAYPAAIDQIFKYSLEAFQDVTGVNAEILGLADRTQPGVLEQQRKESVYGQLQVFFDSLRHYRKEEGRILAEFIKNYIASDDGSRLIRIVGEEGIKYIPLLRSQVDIKYDVMIGESPTSPNQRERTASILMQIVPVMLQSGIPIPPDVLDYMPLPEPLIEKWKGMITQQSQDPLAEEKQRIEMMLNQMNLERQQLRNEEIATGIDYKKAQSEKELAQAADYYARSKEDNSDALKNVMDVYQMQSEEQRKNLELALKERKARIDEMMKARQMRIQ